MLLFALKLHFKGKRLEASLFHESTSSLFRYFTLLQKKGEFVIAMSAAAKQVQKLLSTLFISRRSATSEQHSSTAAHFLRFKLEVV